MRKALTTLLVFKMNKLKLINKQEAKSDFGKSIRILCDPLAQSGEWHG